MADPISLASGLLALATFALQSSVTLYNTIQSYKVHLKSVRDLNEELEALNGVLRSLTGTVGANTDIDLSALDLPLLRCGNACKDFEQEILKCTSRSSGDRRSFRDWAKLRYMGEDIYGFKQLLAGYKSTINIALTDANLRRSSITAENIEGYRELIKTATDDLEAHLQNIDEKLDTILSRTTTASASDENDLRLIRDERLSTQRCLDICAQLSDHINQIQLLPRSIDAETLPGRVTSEGLQECKDSLRATVARLERHMHHLFDQLITKSKTAMTSEEEIEDLRRLREEWETARQCIDICSKADNSLKENISVIDNYATGDETVQFLVSTDGKTIHGKNRGLGWRTRQVGGHIGEATLIQISKDISSISSPSTATANTGPSSQGRMPSRPDDAAQNEPSSDFGGRYGPGFKLTSKSISDPDLTLQSSTEAGASSSPTHEGGKPRAT